MPNPITVTFDGTNVTLPADADIEVSSGPNPTLIHFNLGASAPQGAAIVGVEFPKAVEPTGDFEPDKVFDNKHTITKDSVTHTLFGTMVGRNLNLSDADNATETSGEEDYAYKVWVQVGTEYYSSPDPVIKNDPPPHQG